MHSESKPTRPAFRYHGGKWRIAPWVIAHLPAHKTYVEPFGGAMSVLLRKDRSYAEVYNDLDGEIVNFFRVAREHGKEFQDLLRLTPYAREEFLAAYEPTDDPIERARRTIIRASMGFSSVGIMRKTGFRSNTKRQHTTPVMDWTSYERAFPGIVDRLRGVIIEHKDAISVMRDHDDPDTLFYVDPPYVHSTRSAKEYKYEMDDQAHRDLAAFLNEVKGKVVVSGYHSDLYEEIYSGWKKVEKEAMSDGAGKRVEVLWIKPW